MASFDTPAVLIRADNPPEEAWIRSGRLGNISKADLFLGILLVIGGFCLTWITSHALPLVLREHTTENVWFESDVARVYSNMTWRLANNYRANVHPIFSLATLPAVLVIKRLLHVDANEAVDIVLCLIAASWAGLMFAVLRALQNGRSVSFLLTCLGLASSTSLLFFSVPETYSLSSVSILLSLLLMSLARLGRLYEPLTMLASAASLSVTVTNWFLGLAATFLRLPFRRAVQTSINAFFIVAMLWSVQKLVVPSSDFFTGLGYEHKYTVKVTPERPLTVLSSMLFHTLILPEPKLTYDFEIGEGVGSDCWFDAMTLQPRAPGSGSWFGAVGVVFWAGLLALGLRQVASRWKQHQTVLLVTLFLAMQMCLHLIYGIETFMYSMNWLPLLVVIAALGLSSIPKMAQLPFVAALVVLTVTNNYKQFQWILHYLGNHHWDPAIRCFPHMG